MQIPVNSPVITGAARRYVDEALQSGWVSSAGPAVAAFESQFARYLGVRHAVSCSSGTSALHLALLALRVGPGDEVVVPDFTMFSPVAAVLYAGARPVLVDCDPETFNVDVEGAIKAITPRTKAIVPVHMFGHSADMDPLLACAAKSRIAVIEDAAQAHGARYKGRLCGSMGTIGCFSFYANKIITTGEGGMLVTDDEDIADRARRLRNMAHSSGKRFRHDELGYSYRMGNLQAACGLGQLENVDEFLRRKRWLAEQYTRRLRKHAQLRLPVTQPSCDNVFWMYAVLLQPGCPLSRDDFRAHLCRRGIETREFFSSAARQPPMMALTPLQGPFPVSDDVGARGLYLPSGLAISETQLEYVCDAIDEILG